MQTHGSLATRAIVPARTCFHGLTRLSAQRSAVSLCADTGGLILSWKLGGADRLAFESGHQIAVRPWCTLVAETRPARYRRRRC